MKIIVSYLIGLLFGAGIIISGMSNPAKVLNFFDLAGTWDPSLIFVMGGALMVTFIGYRLVFTRKSPIIENTFHVPATGGGMDMRLVAGSVIFGIGWGIAGFCPGGAIPALGTGRYEVIIFVSALVVGIIATRMVLAGLSENTSSRQEGK